MLSHNSSATAYSRRAWISRLGAGTGALGL
ncbi:MAG: hypothetical protein RLZZ458_1951, partial [Planctomycetota bacterium]